MVIPRYCLIILCFPDLILTKLRCAQTHVVRIISSYTKGEVLKACGSALVEAQNKPLEPLLLGQSLKLWPLAKAIVGELEGLALDFTKANFWEPTRAMPA